MKKSDITLAALWSAVACLLVATIAIVSGNFGVNLSGDINYSGAIAATPVQGTPAVSENPTAAPQTTQPTNAPDASTGDDNTADVPGDSTGKSDTGLPTEAADILAKYTEVMNQAKSDAPGFLKVEYQNIPEEKAAFEGKVMSTALPLLNSFFKDEETARANAENKAKGESMEWFPIYHNDKGCLLTDASCISSATCTDQGDGTVKITIVLNTETNSEPPAANAATSSSFVGAMFTPIELATVNDILKNNTAVKLVARNIDYDLIYHDCTVDLVYNPENNHIVSLDQFMHMTMDIKGGTIVGSSAVGKAELDNYMYISDFQY